MGKVKWANHALGQYGEECRTGSHRICDATRMGQHCLCPCHLCHYSAFGNLLEQCSWCFLPKSAHHQVSDMP